MKEDLKKIIDTYGIRNQLRKFNEETYELIEAINDYERQKEACENMGCSKVHADKKLEHIAEEIGDVRVMLYQLQYHYGIEEEDIWDVIKFKTKRQLERIKNSK